jgi:hypothetical protein
VVLDLVVEILGRDTVCEAFVLPAGTTALLGQIPLEALDLIVDPSSREVRVNPASPDAPLSASARWRARTLGSAGGAGARPYTRARTHGNVPPHTIGRLPRARMSSMACPASSARKG